MWFGLASRLARREVRRRPGRTLLVALLVALPTIALGGAAIIAATARSTPDNKYRAHYGDVDFVVDVGGPNVEGAPTDPVPALLQAARSAFGSTTQVALRSYASLPARAQNADVPRGRRSKYLLVHTADIRDPLIAPLYDLRAGRAPTRAGEVAVSTRLASAWNLTPGDTLTLSRPALAATVVGVVRDRTDYGWTGLMALSGNAFALPENAGQSLLLVDTPLPVSYSQAARVVDDSLAALPDRLYTSERNQFEAPSDPVLLLGSVFAVVGFAVLSIIVTAAFATSARRQLVTIGQLVSNGAPRRLVRTSLALQGAWSAAVGLALSAVVLGLGFGFGKSTLATLLEHDVPSLRVPTGQLIGIALIATVASTVAAYLPARSATRVSVLDALAGRRPLASVPRRLLPIGIVTFAAGVGLELLTTLAVTGDDGVSGSDSNAFLISGALGALLILGGMCCASPTIVSVLGPLARRMRGAARLTARSIARSRPRTAAVVASIAAFGAAGIAMSTFIITDRADSGVNNAYLPDNVVMLSANRCPNPSASGVQLADIDPTSPVEPCTLTTPDAAITTEVEEILGASAKTALRWATFDPAPYDPSATPVSDAIVLQDPGAIQVATPRLLDLMGMSQSDRSRLNQAGILWLMDPGQGQGAYGPGVSADPEVRRASLILRTRSGDRRVEAGINSDALRYYGLAGFVITETKANALGLPIREAGGLYTLPRRMSEAQRVELSFLAYGGVDSNHPESLNIAYSYFRPAIDSGVIEAAIALGVLLIALLIVAIGLALNATEGKDERDVLVAIGARPRTLSALSALRAFTLSAFGVLLAIPVGLVPSLVVIHASQAGEQRPEGPITPWLTIVLLLCIPFAAYAAARASSSIGRRFRPVRMSTFAFD